MANRINKILLTSEHEENLIEIESDVSTVTENPVANTRAKRKQDHNMSDNNPSSLLPKKRRKSNILEFISEQRAGNKHYSVFNPNVTALKIKGLKSTNCLTTVHSELHVSDCEYIRSGQDGRSILGIWSGDQYDAILYKLVLNLSSRGSSVEDDVPNFFNSIEYVGPFFSKAEIKDICDTNCGDRKFVLYVGSHYNRNILKQSSAILCSFTNNSLSYTTTGKQYLSLRELLSCSGSQNGDVFATGSEEGVFIYKDQEFIFHNPYVGRVSSVEFNSAGNILYCGIKNSGLTMFDSRETSWKKSTVKLMNYSSGISETKLFSNENNMVVSGFDGSLSQIDLRKRETVFIYPNHIGVNKKSPFSLSEYTDILCATGADKTTRLWSLSAGSHLCTIEPPIKTKKVHSCLIADECRWLVAIFQQNKMYILESES